MNWIIVEGNEDLKITVNQRNIRIPNKLTKEKDKYAQLYKSKETNEIGIKLLEKEESNVVEVSRTKNGTFIYGAKIIKELGLKEGKYTTRQEDGMIVFNPYS